MSNLNISNINFYGIKFPRKISGMRYGNKGYVDTFEKSQQQNNPYKINPNMVPAKQEDIDEAVSLLSIAGYNEEDIAKITGEVNTKDKARIVKKMAAQRDDSEKPVIYSPFEFSKILKGIVNTSQADMVCKLIDRNNDNYYLYSIVIASSYLDDKRYLNFVNTCIDAENVKLTNADINNYLCAMESPENANKASEIVTKSVERIEKENFAYLLSLYEKNPKKAETIISSAYLTRIFNSANKYKKYPDIYKAIYESIVKLDIKGLQDLDKFSQNIFKRNAQVSPEALIGLYNLKLKNEKAYNYILASDELFNKFTDYKQFHLIASYLDIPILIEAEKGIERAKDKDFESLMLDYINNKDSFCQDSNKVEKLRERLSDCPIEDDTKVFMTEPDTSSFASIDMSATKLAKKAKRLVLLNKRHANNCMISMPSESDDNSKKTESVYDYIMKKTHLTLADIMQTARYGDENFIREIINEISKAVFFDDKFKSASLSPLLNSNSDEFDNVISEQASTITVSASMMLKNGVNGTFFDSDNKPFTFLISDDGKVIEYNNGYYDREKNQFVLSGDVSSVN